MDANVQAAPALVIRCSWSRTTLELFLSCAWPLPFCGPLQPDDNISHGICPSCREKAFPRKVTA